MKPIVWIRHVKISTTGGPPAPQGEHPRVPRLTLADKTALVVLAAGLLALGGVLLAAGVALLLALFAGGLVLGGATFARHRLFGRPRAALRPDEISPDGAVLPASGTPSLPPASPTSPTAPTAPTAPRGD